MKRILFIDDEPRILEGLRNLLHRHRRKWDMTFVADGSTAIELLETQRFDVIVSDLQMSGIDGATLLAYVQRRHPSTVRIVLSAHTDPQASLKALPVAHQFLTKPCDALELENVVERACAIRSLVDDPKIQQLIGGIKQLPTLPRIYQRLTQALAEDRTQAKDVAALLQQDTAICAKLLQIVNSAFFRLARHITSVEEAVRYLGFTVVRNLALTMEIFDGDVQPTGFSFEALQQHALQVAVLAGRITTDRRRADDAFTAGILHDIGLMVLALRMPESWQQTLILANQRQQPLCQVEKELLGVSHAEAGAYLLGLWGLPYPIIEAVAYHHHPRAVPPYEFDALAAVYVANLLVHEASLSIVELPAELLDKNYLATLGVLDRLDGWRTLAAAQPAVFIQE